MANRTKTTKAASKATKRRPARKAIGAKDGEGLQAARQELRAADARTRAFITSREAQVVDMVGGSGRNAVRAELVPLHGALVKVRCCCSELAQLAAELPRLPKSVVRGRWSEDWATAYPQWWDAIQAARALAGSPAVAAIMDTGELRPAEKWTSRTVADLDRLAATHHPSREGGSGLGFIRVGRESLSTDFVPCAAAIATRLVELQSVPKAESVAPKDDDNDWKPASHFPKPIRSRLRHATGKNRKTKKVRRKTVGGTVLYSLSDAKRWWGAELR